MYSNSLICNILKYINNNINSKIAIEDIENQFHYNRYYIMKLFKKELNITIIDYINKIRIYNCFINMKESHNNISRIAYNNAFYSIEYFSETFKKIIGVKPQIVKRYIKGLPIQEKDINIINNSISNLYILKIRMLKYIENEKKDLSVPKVLSIFK